MRERGPLGAPSGAAGELDVDRVVGVAASLVCFYLLDTDARSGVEQLQPGQVGVHTRPDVAIGSDGDHLLERGAGLSDVFQHGEVVDVAEPGHGGQEPDACFRQRVGKLARAVRGVDVHQDGTDHRTAKLQLGPLDPGRSPDANPVPGLEAEGQQPPGDQSGAFGQLGPCESKALVPTD